MMGHRNKFQEEWLEDEKLKAWLVKVENDSTKSYCRFCAIVLRAHKSDILNHGITGKHATNTKIAMENGVSTAPISVQIVCNDDDETENLEGDQQDLDDSGSPMEKKFVSATKRKSVPPNKKSSYPKRYRVEWQDVEGLKDWIKPYRPDETKAFCKVCQVPLRAHKHDLILHAKASKHMKLAENFNFSQVDDTHDSFDEMIGPDDECSEASTSTSNIKRMKIEMVNNFMEDTEILNDGNDGICEDMDGEQVGITPDIKSTKSHKKSKVKSIVKQEPTSHYTPRRRQVFINAADVVAAIENNEFTGYELLQIVKTAVPKL